MFWMKSLFNAAVDLLDDVTTGQQIKRGVLAIHKAVYNPGDPSCTINNRHLWQRFQQRLTENVSQYDQSTGSEGLSWKALGQMLMNTAETVQDEVVFPSDKNRMYFLSNACCNIASLPERNKDDRRVLSLFETQADPNSFLQCFLRANNPNDFDQLVKDGAFPVRQPRRPRARTFFW